MLPGGPGVYSKKWVGTWNAPALAAKRTLPFGNTAAGALPKAQGEVAGLPQADGRSRPADQLLVAMLKSAVCAVFLVLAPNAITDPSYVITCGPAWKVGMPFSADRKGTRLNSSHLGISY